MVTSFLDSRQLSYWVDSDLEPALPVCVEDERAIELFTCLKGRRKCIAVAIDADLSRQHRTVDASLHRLNVSWRVLLNFHLRFWFFTLN